MSRGPPDLQALVEQHGGYHRIPDDAWAAFDKAMAKYLAAIRESAQKPAPPMKR